MKKILLRTIVLFIVLLASTLTGQSQEPEPKNWQLNGYVKNLQTLIWFNDAFPDLQQGALVDTFLQDNLLHHRLNFKWFANDHLNFYAELRSRVFFGDLVKADPTYARQIDNVNNDYFDLSLVLLDDPSFVVHTMLDRLYLEYFSDKWEVRLGRQRINWGINSVWNPNDIFNAFAFTDFDYEERPGSDALRVKYYTGFASSLELAAKAFDDFDQAVIAGMWRFNRWQYDFQLLGGYMEQHLVAGLGWAGNLGDAGFKGEATWFGGLTEELDNSFAATFALDYVFSNSLYLNGGYLYNSNGATSTGVGNLFSFDLSARNLYPYRHAMLWQASYPINPLLNSSLAVIYSPVDVHPLFLNPVLTLSIEQNWDLDFVGQLVFNRNDGSYTSPIQALFLRLKFSY